jgi:thermostable 8-oxoguanine DNA glycosylase
MESKLQAENQELTEQLRELSERFDNVVADNLTKAAQITKLRQQKADLVKEVARLADIILDKEGKGQ